MHPPMMASTFPLFSCRFAPRQNGIIVRAIVSRHEKSRKPIQGVDPVALVDVGDIVGCPLPLTLLTMQERGE